MLAAAAPVGARPSQLETMSSRRAPGGRIKGRRVQRRSCPWVPMNSGASPAAILTNICRSSSRLLARPRTRTRRGRDVRLVTVSSPRAARAAVVAIIARARNTGPAGETSTGPAALATTVRSTPSVPPAAGRRHPSTAPAATASPAKKAKGASQRSNVGEVAMWGLGPLSAVGPCDLSPNHDPASSSSISRFAHETRPHKVAGPSSVLAEWRTSGLSVVLGFPGV